MIETQPVPIPMDEFIKNMLGAVEIKDKDKPGERINLRDHLGDRYDRYEGLVLERIMYIDTSFTKRPEREGFEVSFNQRAREAGFSGSHLAGIKTRASFLYKSWLSYKHGEQARTDGFRVRGGSNPNAYLADGSDRKNLGYIQSERKRD